MDYAKSLRINMEENNSKKLRRRSTNINVNSAEFKKAGYWLVDQIAALFEEMDTRPLTTIKSGEEIANLLQQKAQFGEDGQPLQTLIEGTTEFLTTNSLYNGHPGFMGYITSSPAPLGVLADMLAAAVNPNVGASTLSPAATQMERQAIQWIAEFIGYPSDAGIMVSGGNMANFVGFVAGMRAKLGLDIRSTGLINTDKSPVVYTSRETHTWIQKAMDLFGLGTDQIRWIGTDEHRQMNLEELDQTIKEDLRNNKNPIMIIGTAGSVSMGVLDPLAEIYKISQKHRLWFHIDGAYGGFAASLPELQDQFAGFAMADSIAVDPHKWLYAPLEVGCTLVKNAQYLTDAFSYHPPYYQFSNTEVNFVDYGLQNSRGFRALKVWLSLQHLGINGYRQLIREDIALASYAYQLFDADPALEVVSNYLSITTFRYVPLHLKDRDDEHTLNYLNKLNQTLLSRLNHSQELFLSNAIDQGRFLLRMCIVNFRTTTEVLDKIPGLVKKYGTEVEQEMQLTS
ncbi:MAG: aminotransferase class V-fold PLP-dependent enzyme [Saprospiraceae bacterium]|nr:aminotransferase class V-fold PLP-dependent enzyme [Saprospiraceae bacterium]